MDQALRTMIDNIPAKTGKTLEEWTVLLRQENFNKHSEAVAFLKTNYGVTHGFANTIVTLSKEERDAIDLVTTQYEGKESLKPIYDLLIATMTKFGDDVVVAPKKTSVSIIRKNQFALIKPATKKRIDLGLKLKGVEIQGRLENSGPFGTMCTHRIQLQQVKEVDKEVVSWLLKAYEMSL